MPIDNGLPDLGTGTDFSFEQPQEHQQGAIGNWFDTDL